MPGKETTDAIFTVRQMQEKYECKGKKLYFAIVDLEKAFDRVPREVSMGSKEGRSGGMVGECSRDVYEGAQTVVRTTEGDSKAFNVKVGLHQGSVLSHLLFVKKEGNDFFSRELRTGLPWIYCMQMT